MGKVEWAFVGYLLLFLALLLRDDITPLFTLVFLLLLAAVAGVFMYGVTND